MPGSAMRRLDSRQRVFSKGRCTESARTGCARTRLRSLRASFSSSPLPFVTAPRVMLLLVTTFVVPTAGAEIFRCVAKDGVDLYQNFPCQFQSIGWVPTSIGVPPAQLAPIPSRQPNTNTRGHADTVASRSTSSQSTLQVGMTTEAVRAMWGEPTDSHWEEPGVGERSEVWLYGNARSVRFIDGRVSALRR
jgi:hypothetical protein